MKKSILKITKFILVVTFLFNLNLFSSDFYIPKFPQDFENITYRTPFKVDEKTIIKSFFEKTIKQFSIGKNYIWVIDDENQIFKSNKIIFQKIRFTKIKGPKLKQISVGYDDSVWGISEKGKIYRYNYKKNSWKRIRGNLEQISVGNKNYIFGIDKNNLLYKWNPKWWKRNKWEHFKLPNFVKLKNVVIGELYGIAKHPEKAPAWVKDYKQLFWQWNQTEKNWNKIIYNFELQQISIGDKNNIVATDTSNTAYIYNPIKKAFEKIGDGIQHISINKDKEIIILNKDKELYKYKKTNELIALAKLKYPKIIEKLDKLDKEKLKTLTDFNQLTEKEKLTPEEIANLIIYFTNEVEIQYKKSQTKYSEDQKKSIVLKIGDLYLFHNIAADITKYEFRRKRNLMLATELCKEIHKDLQSFTKLQNLFTTKKLTPKELENLTTYFSNEIETQYKKSQTKYSEDQKKSIHIKITDLKNQNLTQAIESCKQIHKDLQDFSKYQDKTLFISKMTKTLNNLIEKFKDYKEQATKKGFEEEFNEINPNLEQQETLLKLLQKYKLQKLSDKNREKTFTQFIKSIQTAVNKAGLIAKKTVEKAKSKN
ncbi:hypothetical protein KAT08_03965 [Candidatus Babeliales bacterium]|nr:hypothetical protein [Candidatus Babeliales bacterium]